MLTTNSQGAILTGSHSSTTNKEDLQMDFTPKLVLSVSALALFLFSGSLPALAGYSGVQNNSQILKEQQSISSQQNTSSWKFSVVSTKNISEQNLNVIRNGLIQWDENKFVQFFGSDFTNQILDSFLDQKFSESQFRLTEFEISGSVTSKAFYFIMDPGGEAFEVLEVPTI